MREKLKKISNNNAGKVVLSACRYFSYKFVTLKFSEQMHIIRAPDRYTNTIKI